MTVDVSLGAKWRRYTTKISATRKTDGPAAAVLLAGRWGRSFVHRQAAATRDRLYDRWIGVDTVADQPGLEVPRGVAYDDAVYYARTSPRVFPKVMRDAGVFPAAFTFVDLGCGKGAALLLALDAGFASVVGVERNDRLVPIARRNVETYRSRKEIDRPVEVIHGDAVHFAFPDAPTVLYLYNPFGPETLTAVLRNLEESLRQHPRDVVVAYSSPAQRELLDACPWLDRVPVRSRKWAIYRSGDRSWVSG
jgi:SAM-dependent methyltransferase